MNFLAIRVLRLEFRPKKDRWLLLKKSRLVCIPGSEPHASPRFAARHGAAGCLRGHGTVAFPDRRGVPAAKRSCIRARKRNELGQRALELLRRAQLTSFMCTTPGEKFGAVSFCLAFKYI